MSDTRRAAIIVLDGLGCGAAPDTAAYGDAGSDTLGNVARDVGGLMLPNLERLGLGRCAPIRGLTPVPAPMAAHGILEPVVTGSSVASSSRKRSRPTRTGFPMR